MANILIYTRAGTFEGMGHVVRCRHLAEALMAKGHKVQILNNYENALQYLADNSIPHHDFPAEEGTIDETTLLKTYEDWDCLIVDVPYTDDELLKALRSQFPKLVVLAGVGRTVTKLTHWIADLVVYQSPFRSMLHKRIPGENVISGMENIIMDPQYNEPQPPFDDRADIIVYIGGGGPIGFAEEVWEEFKAYDVEVVDLGIWQWVSNVCEQLGRANVFVGTMGMIAYEAMAAGLYPIVGCRSEDHHQTATYIGQHRLASIGLLEALSPREFVHRAMEVYEKAMGVLERREKAGQRQGYYRHPDGLGVYRVAERVIDIL